MSDSIEVARQLCPQCAKEIDVDARFCKYCAFDLTTTQRTQADQNTSPTFGIDQNPTRNNLPLIVGGVVGVVVILIGLVTLVAYFKLRNSSGTANSNSSQPSTTMTLSANGLKAEEKILRGEALNQSDIQGLSNDELRIVRNVHFARYGRKFDKPGLGDYFYTRPWYKPNDTYADTMLNATDKANVDLIVRAEKGEGSQLNASTENSENDVPDVTAQAYKEATKWWAERVAECNGNYYWAQQEKGRPKQYAQIFYECKNKPIVMVDGQAQTARVLSEADRLNGVDPLPIEWQGNAIAEFSTCRSDTIMGPNWSNWENTVEIKSKLKKVKGEWILDNNNTGSYFIVDVLKIDCKWVSEYFDAQNLSR